MGGWVLVMAGGEPLCADADGMAWLDSNEPLFSR